MHSPYTHLSSLVISPQTTSSTLFSRHFQSTTIIEKDCRFGHAKLLVPVFQLNIIIYSRGTYSSSFSFYFIGHFLELLYVTCIIEKLFLVLYVHNIICTSCIYFVASVIITIGCSSLGFFFPCVYAISRLSDISIVECRVIDASE